MLAVQCEEATDHHEEDRWSSQVLGRAAGVLALTVEGQDFLCCNWRILVFVNHLIQLIV